MSDGPTGISSSPTTQGAQSIHVAEPTHISAQDATCKEAPERVVDIINSQFTNGEHLAHAQSVEGTNAETFVGGNIMSGETKVSSQNTWVLRNGAVFALTSNARRYTMLPDGRKLVTDWSDFNAMVSECVGRVERTANSGA